MANGICVYAESYKGKLEPVAAELVSAAKEIQKTTGEKVQAIVLAEDPDGIAAELDRLGVEEIYAVKAGRDCSQQDDAVSEAISEMLKKIGPSSVLIPATPEGRSIFSRVAMKLGCGLTADCTEVLVGTKEDGSYYIKQNKPSFGENVFVTIITRDGYYPQMMTVRPGVYVPQEEAAGGQAKIEYFEDIKVGDSKIEVIGEAEAENEMIPFNHQIGQTGLTIRPKICISFGVSGAIQHTEGIKDTKLFVAVNTDEDAAIFGVADYGITADLKDILENYLAI